MHATVRTCVGRRVGQLPHPHPVNVILNVSTYAAASLSGASGLRFVAFSNEGLLFRYPNTSLDALHCVAMFANHLREKLEPSNRDLSELEKETAESAEDQHLSLEEIQAQYQW